MITAKDKILRRINRKAPRWIFTAKDFLDISRRDLIDKHLSNLSREHKIRRLGRGLYDRIRKDERLGDLGPHMEEAAKAIARKFGWTIFPQGAMAANLLGLSQQVPARIAFLSNGPSRKFSVGDVEIQFRHARQKDMRAKHYSSGVIIQGLRYLGKEAMDDKTTDYLCAHLSPREKRRFLDDSRYGSDWIYQIAQKIQEDHS